MNPFSKAYYNLLNWPIRVVYYHLKRKSQLLVEGEGSIAKAPDILKEKGFSHPLVIAGNSARTTKNIDPLIERLALSGLEFTIHLGVKENPSVEEANNLARKARENKVDSIIAVGGGSILDIGKAVAIALSSPKPLEQSLGHLKVKNAPLFLIAVPTTVGSGSEATGAFVLTSKERKIASYSPKCIPDVAILDPLLVWTLPREVALNSGMDTMSHAIESYIGKLGKKEIVKEKAMKGLIYGKSFIEMAGTPSDELHRREALRGAHYAGEAFERGMVGYVHALSHAIGGLTDLSHGYLNALFLPFVLEAYGRKIAKKKLAIGWALRSKGDPLEALGKISRFYKVDGNPLKEIMTEDLIKDAAHRAHKEANPLYPVPRRLGEKELLSIIKKAVN